MSQGRLALITGPTGSGKTELAIRLAETVGGEIVNADSIQIYRGFDIGSAKPSTSERTRVPHHLFDSIEAADEYNAADYARDAATTIDEIRRRGRLPILCGGTGFWIRALLAGLPEMPGRSEEIRVRLRALAKTARGLQRLHRWLARVDPVSASRIAPSDRHRVERALEVWVLAQKPISSWTRPDSGAVERFETAKFAIEVPREELVRVLDSRVEMMYQAGLVEETRQLMARHPSSARPFASIGYAEAVRHIDGSLTLTEAITETKRRTRAYAKRQMTWLRKEPGVTWLRRSATDEMLQAVTSELERRWEIRT